MPSLKLQRSNPAPGISSQSVACSGTPTPFRGFHRLAAGGVKMLPRPLVSTGVYYSSAVPGSPFAGQFIPATILVALAKPVLDGCHFEDCAADIHA